MTSLLAPPAPPRSDERDDAPKARSACVVVGASPAQVAAVADSDRIAIAANRHGSLVTGRLGSIPVDYAEAFAGPVYDILYNPTSGWFAVTVYRGVEDSPVRFDNRPGQDAGYPRVPDILGATTPLDILAVLDVPAAAIAYRS